MKIGEGSPLFLFLTFWPTYARSNFNKTPHEISNFRLTVIEAVSDTSSDVLRPNFLTATLLTKAVLLSSSPSYARTAMSATQLLRTCKPRSRSMHARTRCQTDRKVEGISILRSSRSGETEHENAFIASIESNFSDQSRRSLLDIHREQCAHHLSALQIQH